MQIVYISKIPSLTAHLQCSVRDRWGTVGVHRDEEKPRNPCSSLWGRKLSCGRHRKFLKQSLGISQKASASRVPCVPYFVTGSVRMRSKLCHCSDFYAFFNSLWGSWAVEYLQDLQADLQDHFIFFFIFINIKYP